MRILWRGLELPSQVIRDEQVSSETYGRFVAEPFERGFGTTIGNSLRRILLSSLEGAAASWIRLKGADHEFCSLPGVMEDVTDIVLNVKSMIVRLDGDEPVELTLSVKQAGPVKAGMLSEDNRVKILNPDLVLATLSENVPFEMSIRVEKGRGFIVASEHIEKQGEEQRVGWIAVDSVYSPVLRVRYDVDAARVGQRTDYDKLIMEIWTNGTVTPEIALVEAGKILRKHLNPFVQYFDLGRETLSAEAAAHLVAAPAVADDAEAQAKAQTALDSLGLSARSMDALRDELKLVTVGELVAKTEDELLAVEGFGKVGLREVKAKLAELGLKLAASTDSAAEAEGDSATKA